MAYIIYKGKKGYSFSLLAKNRQPLGYSRLYKNIFNAKAGIESLKRIAPIAGIEDTQFSRKNPKFSISLSAKKEYKWVLYANNGQALFESKAYSSLAAAKKGIASVIANSDTSIIEVKEE